MHTTAIKRVEMMHKILKIPDQNLDAIECYLNELSAEENREKMKSISLKGIWKKTKFDKILNLDSEIKKTRVELNNLILKKSV